MALSTFGVKYRLDFSNSETLTKYRLDILKDGYASTVIDLTGTGNPVSIEWLRNDNIETPIMGSICNINLYEEDGQDLSEFNTSDEKEFLVYVYQYNGSSYDLFWKGWIIQQDFIEHVNTPPVSYNLKAADNVASLGREEIFSSVNLNSRVTPFDVIKEYIDESGLEFDFVDVTDFKREDVASYATSSVFLQFKFVANALLENRSNTGKFVSYRDAVESVFRSFNVRLCQANGKLYAFNTMSLAFPSTITPNKTHTYDYSSSTWSAGTLSRTSIDVPDDLLPIDQSLYIRHTNGFVKYQRSYKATPYNLLYNGGFELGNGSGWTTVGATFPTDNAKSGEYSILFSGVTNVSDGTFNGASTTDKNTTYRILEASTDPSGVASHDIKFYRPVSGVIDDGSRLDLIFEFSYYIDETDITSVYDIRYSIEKEDEGTYFDVGSVGDDGVAFPISGFQYKEIQQSQVKKWHTETVRLQIAIGSSVSTPTLQEAFTLRIHSTNGTNATTDIYFDDFKLIATPRLPNQLGTGYNKQTEFYNIESSASSNLGQIKRDSLLMGFTNTVTDVIVGAANDGLSGKILGAYMSASVSGNVDAKKVDYYPKELDPSYAERYLEDWCVDQLMTFYTGSNRRAQGTLSEINNVPTPIDVLNISFNTKSYGNFGFTYLKLNLKTNRFDFESLNLTQLPNASALTTTVTSDYSESEFDIS